MREGEVGLEDVLLEGGDPLEVGEEVEVVVAAIIIMLEAVVVAEVTAGHLDHHLAEVTAGGRLDHHLVEVTVDRLDHHLGNTGRDKREVWGL
jgi:hypothetical protein